MAARKTGQKSSEEFWSKVLSAPKVRRILENRGFSPDGFRKDYEADTSLGFGAVKTLCGRFGVFASRSGKPVHQILR